MPIPIPMATATATRARVIMASAFAMPSAPALMASMPMVPAVPKFLKPKTRLPRALPIPLKDEASRPITPENAFLALMSISSESALSPAIASVPFCRLLLRLYLRLDLGIVVCLFFFAGNQHQRLYLHLLDRRCQVAPVPTKEWVELGS